MGTIKIRSWRVPLRVFAVGVISLFGYQYLYFSAFQHAPAVEVNLINYLWPLFIVLFSPLYLRDFSLRRSHIWGAAVGFLGASLIVTGGSLGLRLVNMEGYLYAFGAALVWSSYSLIIKRLPSFPASAVSGFLLTSGIVALATYFFIDRSSQADVSLSSRDWLYLLMLGAGPQGTAIITWNIALQRGDPRIIGSLAYLTPLFSTLILALFGRGHLTWITWVAMVLILIGTVISSSELLRRSPSTVEIAIETVHRVEQYPSS